MPTFAEAGVDYPGFGWWGVAAPKGTPQPIIGRLAKEFAAFLKKDRQDAELLIKLSNQPRTEYKPE